MTHLIHHKMEEIILVPYSKLEDKLFSQEVVLSVKGETFQKVDFQGGKATYAIINCNFRKISIRNSIEIRFGDILINFYGCYIEQIDIDNIESRNINVSFISSIISGRIANKL